LLLVHDTFEDLVAILLVIRLSFVLVVLYLLTCHFLLSLTRASLFNALFAWLAGICHFRFIVDPHSVEISRFEAVALTSAARGWQISLLGTFLGRCLLDGLTFCVLDVVAKGETWLTSLLKQFT
jgi:N-acyl-L-homoserine lactone synthetase